VDEVMMLFAQRQEVVEIGAAEVSPPPAHVMEPAGVECDGAARMATRAVMRA